MDYAQAPLTVADTADWSALDSAISAFDGTMETYSAADLAEELADPELDPEADTIGFRSPGGEFVAFGQLWHRSALIDGAVVSILSGGVHPEHRGRGLGTAIFDRMESRLVEVGARRHPGAPVIARSEAGAQVASHRRLLDRRGYVETRYFHEMTHDLSHVGSAVDPGLGIRAYRAADNDQVRRAHEAAFARHWNFAPMTVEEWNTRLTGSRTFRPGASFVRVGADGAVDGYVLSYQWQDGELWIGQLGVRDEARGRGLGRGLLITAVRAGIELGCTEVGLGVDTDNVTGAGRIYESAGFQVVHTSVAYLKTL